MSNNWNDIRFRAVHRYCLSEEGGYATGFPNFQFGMSPNEVYPVMGVYKIKGDAIETKDISLEVFNRVYHDFSLSDPYLWIRRANELIEELGWKDIYVGAFPTFEVVNENVGVSFIKKEAATYMEIHEEELIFPEKGIDLGELRYKEEVQFRAIDEYKAKFLNAEYGGGFTIFRGRNKFTEPFQIIMIKKKYLDHESIAILHDNVQHYSYEGLKDEFVLFLKKALNEIIRKLDSNSHHISKERGDLIGKMTNTIIKMRPYIGPDNDVNAEADKSDGTGDTIFFDQCKFENMSIDPKVPRAYYRYRELCRTTVHEIMHLAGFKHDDVDKSRPNFTNAAGMGCGKSPIGTTLPDAETYYNTPPLKAECIIDDIQS